MYLLFGVLILWGIVGLATLPRWYDPRFVRYPERQMWSFWRYFNDEEWTEEGLAVRARYVRFYGIALLIMVIGIVVVVIADP